ncbi:cationic peroxidase 2-like [Cryptomeria japonica]|uniref:cationic peroxidase 2-like n=1 Tax=Cryptomeria japonica TaxID=3369 RepID=UPI0025AC8262|nr:cationic peroxidase 2-like [Cryptomeria japonica]
MAFILIIQLSLSWVINTAEAQNTRVGFYSSTCPNVESIVRSTVESHVYSDQTAAPALLRLFFHDCFVQGCDGSILITGPSAEKNALTNLGLRGFDVIEDAKTKVEAACPGVVSCADILALATRDAVVLSKGTSWNVPTGRRDGLVSSSSDAAIMPTPSDSIDVLKKKFSDKGLNTQEFVTLVAAHTIGQTDCQFFNYRLYNFTSDGNADTTINTAFVSELQSACPFGGDASKRVALDKGSQTTFDTSFFKNVRDGNGVLESDQRMWADNSTSPYVRQYAETYYGFGTAFAHAMIKMGNIGVKTGSDGEIRTVCSAFN